MCNGQYDRLRRPSTLIITPPGRTQQPGVATVELRQRWPQRARAAGGGSGALGKGLGGDGHGALHLSETRHSGAADGLVGARRCYEHRRDHQLRIGVDSLGAHPEFEQVERRDLNGRRDIYQRVYTETKNTA